MQKTPDAIVTLSEFDWPVKPDPVETEKKRETTPQLTSSGAKVPLPGPSIFVQENVGEYIQRILRWNSDCTDARSYMRPHLMKDLSFVQWMPIVTFKDRNSKKDYELEIMYPDDWILSSDFDMNRCWFCHRAHSPLNTCGHPVCKDHRGKPCEPCWIR